MGRLGRVSTVLALLALTGCAVSKGIGDASVAYNEGVARASNQLLLLNVIRGSMRHDIIYTRFSGLHGQASGSLKADIPLGSGDWKSFAPSLEISGTPSFDIEVQDNQDFIRAVMSSVDGDTLIFFQDQDWPMDLLLHLFVERISGNEAAISHVQRSSDAICKNASDIEKSGTYDFAHNSETAKQCAFIRYVLSKRPASCTKPYYEEILVDTEERKATKKPAVPQTQIVFDNRPDKDCLFSGFQELVGRLIVLQVRAHSSKSNEALINGIRLGHPGPLTGPLLDAITKANDNDYTLKAAGKRSVTIQKTTKTADMMALLLTNEESNGYKAYRESEQMLSFQQLGSVQSDLPKSAARQRPKEQLGLSLRSPNSMIYYLGEVLRAQYPNAVDDAWNEDRARKVALRVENNCEPAKCKPISLFSVAVDDWRGRSAVRVRDGEHLFSIPQSSSNRALQVIALVEQLLRLNQKAEKAPTTQSVQIVGP
ncbi:MAG: hypothetical protein HY243_16955 [Proteobacteria bacterium]|nr:hypothetical protein [Pseudomonadota bacterium]